jgi:TolA-binding protein
MMKDYHYVTRHAEKMYQNVPEDRKAHLARIISESYLVLGDTDNARKYYDLNTKNDSEKTRADWFYSGSLLYAVDDYKGAIDNYNMVTMRTDSIGQIANYHLGFSYIQTKNKVAAMQAFKDASMVEYDAAIAEDAHFNYAKLAFDLNDDPSIFQDYLAKYPAVEKSDKINSYIAVASLYNHDYAGAVDAYDKIDDLDDKMKANYMKANYLRARQLIASGSYRMAIDCLKVAVYYSERGSRFNQLSRFWLAESYFRNDQYTEARQIFTDLYNTSALYGAPESYLIPYNIAYCFYNEENYPMAVKWFDEYLAERKVEYRKEALERKGDCFFIAKDYDAAYAAYDLVVKDYFDVNDIYPYYQSAIAYGLDKKPAKKIELLSKVLEASPEAKFYPDALFELGRTYAVKEDDENAFKCFNKLAQEVKDSNYVAQAYIEMGSIARNQSQFTEALGYYKTVVEEMPNSGYAENALLAIESIYQTKDQPEEYIAYIENIGKGASKTADEKEMLYFNSAEQLFLSANYQKAIVSLQKYLEKYPSGKNAFKADFYIAESYRSLGRPEQACDFYKKVIADGEGSFVEMSMLNFSKISFDLERWNDAFGGYASLYESAKLENNKFTALVGMMRSAYRGHEWSQAIKNADRVIFDERADAQIKQEADYIKAKSYLATSRREEAFALLEKLSADVKSAYGAEAAYLMVQDSYDRGDFEDVEKKVYAFADAGSGQTYWLAKCFIVLGDSFVEQGELKQAKATFESVRDGYQPSAGGDDVKDNVEMRLTKLEELIAGQNQ